MKRTRHIEITRYSRRVTVSQRSDDTAEPAAELSAIEVAGEWEIIPPGHDEVNDGGLKAGKSDAVPMSRRRPRFSLHDLLRLRKRI